MVNGLPSCPMGKRILKPNFGTQAQGLWEVLCGFGDKVNKHLQAAWSAIMLCFEGSAKLWRNEVDELTSYYFSTVQ